MYKLCWYSLTVLLIDKSFMLIFSFIPLALYRLQSLLDLLLRTVFFQIKWNLTNLFLTNIAFKYNYIFSDSFVIFKIDERAM